MIQIVGGIRLFSLYNETTECRLRFGQTQTKSKERFQRSRTGVYLFISELVYFFDQFYSRRSKFLPEDQPGRLVTRLCGNINGPVLKFPETSQILVQLRQLRLALCRTVFLG